MKQLRLMSILLLCISFLSLQIPNSVMAGYYAKAKSGTGITANPPHVLSTPEESIPVAEGDKTEKKSKTWLYILAGVVVVGLVAAAAAGGSSGGGGSDNPPTQDGSVNVSW